MLAAVRRDLLGVPLAGRLRGAGLGGRRRRRSSRGTASGGCPCSACRCRRGPGSPCRRRRRRPRAGADADAVVAAGAQLELEAEGEVGVLLLGEQISCRRCRDIRSVLLDEIAGTRRANQFRPLRFLPLKSGVKPGSVWAAANEAAIARKQRSFRIVLRFYQLQWPLPCRVQSGYAGEENDRESTKSGS